MSGGNDLYPNVVWDFVVLDETANEHEVRVTGGGVGHLNFLDARLDELPKEGGLLLDGHGICQRLVSIAEISREPDGSFCESFGGPLTILEIQRSVRLVLLGWIWPGLTLVLEKRELGDIQHWHVGGRGTRKF